MDLQPIKARAEAATPAPWFFNSYSIVDSPTTLDTDTYIAHVPAAAGDTATPQGWKDAEFIAHAREDVPALVAEVERLREALSRIAQLPGYDLEAAWNIADGALA